MCEVQSIPSAVKIIAPKITNSLANVINQKGKISPQSFLFSKNGKFGPINKHFSTILIAHIDEFASLVFKEPFSKSAYITLMANSNNKIKIALAKSESFQNIALSLIKNKSVAGIGRLSEFVKQCIDLFPGEIEERFSFIPSLLEFCESPSTCDMFSILINSSEVQPMILKELLINGHYSVLNNLDKDSEFLKLPSTINFASKNPITVENWNFLRKLAEIPEISSNLIGIIKKGMEVIDITYESEYKEIQVIALKFITKIIETCPNCVDEFNHEVVMKIIIKIMTAFKNHTFALRAAVDMIVAIADVPEMKDEMDQFLIPFLIDKVKCEEERILSAFCKYCIDKIYCCGENVYSCNKIPNDIIDICASWYINEFS